MPISIHIDADFCAFFCASLWALGASVAFAQLDGKSRGSWRLLGISWSLRSAFYCLDLFQTDAQTAHWLVVAEGLLDWTSSMGVVAAAALMLPAIKAAKPRLIAIASGVVASAAVMLLFQNSGNIGHDTVALASLLLLASAWYYESRRTASGDRGLRWAGAGLAFYGVAFEYDSLIRAGLLTGPSGIPGAVITYHVIDAGALLFVCLALELRARQGAESGFRTFRRTGRIALCLILTATAVMSAEELGRRFESIRKAQIMSRARLAAAAVPTNNLHRLEWSEQDLRNPDYQYLKILMKSLVGSDSDLRFVLLAGIKGGKSYFIVDSEDPTSKDYSPPGQLYEEADEAYLNGMNSRQPFLLGPITDHWGTWIIASVPIITENGLGFNAELNVAASDWSAVSRTARLPAFLLGFLLIVVALIIFHARQRIKASLADVTRSQQEKDTIIETSPDAVQMIGPDRKFVTANRITESSFGVSLARLPERHFEDIWPDSVRETLRVTAERTLAGETREVEIEYRLPTGENRAWRVATNPIQDAQLKANGFIATCSDITSRKRAERLLCEAKDAAETASRTKSEFLAVMSHEIRTPLGAVIGLLELLRSDPNPTDRKRYSSLARKSAQSLLHILDDLLDASKIEAGKMTIENAPFDLREESLRVLEGMRARAELKGLFLNWSIPEHLPFTVIGDPTRLKQIITNLISNAIKFTPQGGVVASLKAEWQEAGKIAFHLKVSDSGIGMNREVIQKLFCKFEQADASTTRRFGGTGLGLSIVKGLLDCMGGSISVESEIDHGTAFTVIIPMWLGVDLGKPMGTTETVAPWATTCPRLRVLCADDDAINREYIGDTLKVLGHQVTVAENGREALERLRSGHFDVVLMDNRMPVMDGFQASRAIRNGDANERNRTIYIIAITANASAVYREQCLAAGMNAYLAKPMAPRDLDAALLLASQHGSRSQSSTPIPELHALSAEELLASLENDRTASATPDLPGPSLNLVRAYLKETPRRLQEMTDALAQNDSVELARAAHVLKGNSRYAGADEIAIIAAQIQDLADLNEGAEMGPLVEAIKNAFQRIKPALEKRIE